MMAIVNPRKKLPPDIPVKYEIIYKTTRARTYSFSILKNKKSPTQIISKIIPSTIHTNKTYPHFFV